VSRLLAIGVMNQSYDQAQKDVSSKCKECQILIGAMFFCCKSLYSVSVANCTGTKSSSLTRSDTICIDFWISLSGSFSFGEGGNFAKIRPEKYDINLYKGFFMEKLAQIGQISKKNKSNSPDFYDKFQ
jgi:hypothetical protein